MKIAFLQTLLIGIHGLVGVSAMALPIRQGNAYLSSARQPDSVSAAQVRHKKDKETKTEANSANLTLPEYHGPKKRLAVSDLENKVFSSSSFSATPSGTTNTTSANIDTPTSADLGTGMTEMLTTALINSDRFVLLERKSLKDIQDEQALGKTELADPISALKGGTLLGAQAFIRGAITEFSYKKSSTNAGGILGKVFDGSTSSSEALVALDIRIYDAATGQIIDSVRAEGRAKATGASFNITKGDVSLGNSSFSSSPLGHATRDAIEKAVKFICQRMAERPWEGRVADLEVVGEKVTAIYISAGLKEGLKIGDEFEVLHPGRSIVDPQTRVVLGRAPDKTAGKCKITVIMDEFAIATPSEGSGFAKDDVVRMATTALAPSVTGEAGKL